MNRNLEESSKVEVQQRNVPAVFLFVEQKQHLPMRGLTVVNINESGLDYSRADCEDLAC